MSESMLSATYDQPMDLSDETPTGTAYRFTFTGSAPEYFRVWIVNVALSIVTLGIYSAWAKVRNKQYFYGNTHLDDVSFRYLADPKQILKGKHIGWLSNGLDWESRSRFEANIGRLEELRGA